MSGVSSIPPGRGGAGMDTMQAARSLRRENTLRVQRRMQEELLEGFWLHTLVTATLIALGAIMMIWLLVQAVCASVAFHGLPCDKPLGSYVLVSVAVGQLGPVLVKAVHRLPVVRRRPWLMAVVSLCGSMFGLCVIAWGFWMVQSAQTCPTTNPQLFYPLKHYIYGQVLFAVLTTIFFSIAFPRFVAFASRYASRKTEGCRNAVLALPKVQRDADELMDPEEAVIMDCPICAESFDSGGAIVRTPCSHHFHEECLARWCSNHRDCPMCRAPVGDPDPPPP